MNKYLLLFTPIKFLRLNDKQRPYTPPQSPPPLLLSPNHTVTHSENGPVADIRIYVFIHEAALPLSVPPISFSGMLCKLCIKHKSKSTLIKKPWTEVPCVSLFEKSLRRHANSGAHRDAVKIEAEERQSLATGGIERRFENAISMDRMAITGAAKCLYWLAKNDVPHTTKYEPLLDLMKLMGCEYLQNLHKVRY